MIDAMGKPTPDLKHFNLNWLGAYKECLNVRAMNASSGTSNSSISSPLFNGQYCTAHVILQEVCERAFVGSQVRGWKEGGGMKGVGEWDARS